MSDDDKSLVRGFFNKSLAPKEKKEKEKKIAIPPKPRQTFLGQKLDTRRIEEYEKTLRAEGKVVRALGDLEEAVEDLNNVGTRVDTNKHRFLSELEESKQRLEDLMNNNELREEQRKTKILEEKRNQRKIEAEMMDYDAQKEASRAKKIEEEERARKAMEPPPQQPQPKTRIDRINEFERDVRKLRKEIAEILQRNEKTIEEEGKIRGLTDKEIENKKDLEKARWAKIEMEEIQKLERKYM